MSRTWSVRVAPIGNAWKADAEINDEIVYSSSGAATAGIALDGAIDFVLAWLAARAERATDPAMPVVGNDLAPVAGEFETKS